MASMIHDPVEFLEGEFRVAIARVAGIEPAAADPHLRASQNPEFGDYQVNAALPLAKRLKQKPRDIAQRLVDSVAVSAVAEPLEIAGPGFINIRLKPAALASALAAMDDEALGVEPDPDTHPIVIDLCSVNVAKQMHVGHLRSTIIGDALARIFERRGRSVIRQNHLGDWGLPIAMVLHELRESGADLDALTLDALDAAYRDAQLTCKGDLRGLAAAMALHAGAHRIIELEEQNAGAHAALEAAKRTLVKLQQGDDAIVLDWHKLIDCTLSAMQEALDLMNVRLGRQDNRGESFYRDRLPGVVDAFVREAKAVEDEGAIVVRFDDRERPLLIRKSDGGYLYATTDLAAVRYRTQELGADRIIYVVDARQRDHFRDVFDAARLIGWDHTEDGAAAELAHIPFGSVLGGDKKPLKTRSGENVTLMSLLTEATGRALAEVQKRAQSPDSPTHELSAAELQQIGNEVGIAAIKYADLSSDLVRDYVFDVDRMIAFEGATGPYLQYAHARICSIFARAEADQVVVDAAASFTIIEPAEKALALLLMKYGQIVHEVARTLEPHRLCAFLYDLAGAYSTFYQQCPVLRADVAATRSARLRLCDLTRRVLADGLALLGIDAPMRM